MLLIAIKVALAISALTVAVITTLGFRLRDRDAKPGAGFWNRLTRAGKINLASAVATFLLVLTTEIANYFEQEAQTRQAEEERTRAAADRSTLNDELESTKAALGRTIIDVNSLNRRNEYLVQALDKSIIKAGVSRVPIENTRGSGSPLKFDRGGNDIAPKNGDDIEWTFVCNGDLPELGIQSGCNEIAYGRLMANSYAVVLRQASGRQTFFGTRATGGTLEYRNPSEDYSCHDLTERLILGKCELHLTVWREARWQFEDLESRSPAESDAISTQDACRQYEALYGETCEEALDRTARQ